AARLTVSVSVALLFSGVGSVTPAGAATLAVLAIVPVASPAMLAFTVKVTLPPEGSVGMTIPAPCISATVVFGTVGHTAPLLALPVNVAVPPLSRFTLAAMLPLPLAGQLDPALAAQVQAPIVRPAGAVSVTVAPVTALGPLLVVTMV